MYRKIIFENIKTNFHQNFMIYVHTYSIYIMGYLQEESD
jgi:hypothetical protein